MQVKCYSFFFFVLSHVAPFLIPATGHSSYNVYYYADSYNNATNSTAGLLKNLVTSVYTLMTLLTAAPVMFV